MRRKGLVLKSNLQPVRQTGQLGQVAAVGKRGIRTSQDLCDILIAGLEDVAAERRDPKVLGAMSNACGKIVQIVYMESRMVGKRYSAVVLSRAPRAKQIT